jgi:hypothetical protein
MMMMMMNLIHTALARSACSNHHAALVVYAGHNARMCWCVCSYDEHILLNEYPFLDAKATYRFREKVADIMSTDLNVLQLTGNTVASLRMDNKPNAVLHHKSQCNSRSACLLAYLD